jgi:hypothetical protein
MDNYIAYFDETGDDGNNTSSCDTFLLTAIYMPINKWQENYNKIKQLRKNLKQKYGFHSKEEMHTKYFISDKDPYRKYSWTKEVKREIIKEFTVAIANLDITIINTLIDKTKIKKTNYKILETALTYTIQRIENDSKGNWNYLIITDKGRLSPMRKTARSIRAYNPIKSKYSRKTFNKPIDSLIEDILEKDSQESYFIQVSDFVSYFIHLYQKCILNKNPLPNRMSSTIDTIFIKRILETLKSNNKFNLNANKNNPYGVVIYPK